MESKNHYVCARHKSEEECYQCIIADGLHPVHAEILVHATTPDDVDLVHHLGDMAESWFELKRTFLETLERLAKAHARIDKATDGMLALGWTPAQIKKQLDTMEAAKMEEQENPAGDGGLPGMSSQIWLTLPHHARQASRKAQLIVAVDEENMTTDNVQTQAVATSADDYAADTVSESAAAVGNLDAATTGKDKDGCAKL